MAGLSLDLILVLIGGFLVLSILASKVSVKLGIPALVLFLGIGMLAGSDGPGGIHFDDFGLMKSVGMVALAFILFAGGLDTPWSTVKPIWMRGLTLATIGVLVTAGLVGWFAYALLEFSPLEAALLGAVVSCTDAAAVFGVLRGRSIQLKHHITPAVELESGDKDPLAVFLTVSITELIVNPKISVIDLLPSLLLQMPIGFAVGYAGGLATVWLINRVRLEYDGLYPVLSIAAVCLVFGGAHLIGGNEFLAVYVAGLTMGSRNFLHKIALVQFHDGLAWLLQIAMFLGFGLLVFPSQLLTIVGSGLLLSLFLILVARPVAVFISLAFVPLTKRSKFFIAWAGLRGAVPIILATFPLMAGVPKAPEIFNLVFFVVLTSVVLQGASMGAMARWLSVAAPVPQGVSDLTRAKHSDLLEVTIEPGSAASGKQVVELGLPTTALLVLLRRDGDSYIPRGGTILRAGDTLLIATRREDRDELRARFEAE